MFEPERINIGISRPASTVQHALFPVSNQLKTPLLMALLQQTNSESVLIFTRTKHRAQKLTHQLENAGYAATALHSNRSQPQRMEAISGFRTGRYQVMVATDIAARGIDVQSVSHVINYDMPDTVDAYTHRIGRTGRAERTGDAFTLVTPEDRTQIRTLEKVMGEPLKRMTLPNFDYNMPAPSREGRNEHTQHEDNEHEERHVRKPSERRARVQHSRNEQAVPANSGAERRRSSTRRDAPDGQNKAEIAPRKTEKRPASSGKPSKPAGSVRNANTNNPSGTARPATTGTAGKPRRPGSGVKRTQKPTRGNSGKSPSNAGVRPKQ